MKTYYLARNRLEKQLVLIRAIAAIKKNGLWYIDIPRTSSSSVRYSLYCLYGWPYGKSNTFDPGFSTDQAFPDHMTAIEASKRIGSKVWQRLDKFTIVRNPWARVLSMYGYQLKALEIHPTLDFSSYVKSIYQISTGEKNWGFLRYRKLWMPSVDYLRTPSRLVNQKIAIIHFEERNYGLKKYFDSRGLDFPVHTKLQASECHEVTNYRDAYTRETRELVKDIYREDIDYFGYSF